MKKIKIFIYLIIFGVSIVGCGTMQDIGKVMRNEKTNSTDEFLIQKKDPLTQPPDFDVLPTPGGMVEKNEENNIKKMLKVNDKKSTSPSKQSTSTESSIINQIKK